MEQFSVRDIVFVRFPFSDLRNSKLRPAVIISNALHEEWILCQITSKPYADPMSLEINDADFDEGTLKLTSYIRPSKIFTAHESIIVKRAATLSLDTHKSLVDKIIGLIKV